MGQLKSHYPNEPAVRRFENDPFGHVGWMRNALSYEMDSDPDFDREVRALWAKLDSEAPGRLEDAIGRMIEVSTGDIYVGGNVVGADIGAIGDTAIEIGPEDYGPPPGPIIIPDKPE
jgi:hypothetical protein